MTTVSQVIDRIEEKAAGYSPRRAAIGAITIPFWVVGATIGIVARVLWVAGVFVWSAGVVGFQTSFGRKG